MTKSLGLIETQGLAAGVEAADAAVKSANVELIGYELTKGGGWTTVKIQGDVGAVKAAVDAARMAAAKVNRVVSTRVIPRPAAGLETLVHNPDTVGDTPKETDMPKPPTPPDRPEKVKEDEKPVESSEPTETDSKEAPAEDLNAAGQEQTDAPAEESGTSEPDSAKTAVNESDTSEPDEKQPDDKAEPETAVEDTNTAQAVSKPAKRTAAKGRKGGKRSNKHETTE